MRRQRWTLSVTNWPTLVTGVRGPGGLCGGSGRCPAGVRQESFRPRVEQPQLPLRRQLRRRRLEPVDGHLPSRHALRQVRTTATGTVERVDSFQLLGVLEGPILDHGAKCGDDV